MDDQNSLLEAFQWGQLSFMDYYVELRCYRDALETMLEMEIELFQLKTECLKYEG